MVVHVGLVGRITMPASLVFSDDIWYSYI